jgi:beta-aspartyl-dipeptidase (metallo-type)
MMLLVRNADIYAPEALGRRDILAAEGRIIAIAEHIDPSHFPCPVEVLEAEGFFALPGLIDSHVHILGGGGEGGFSTRTPELALSDCVRAGVSTVIGTLGTDGVARSMESLVAKAYALRAEGISAWIYSGSYRVPPQTVTGDLMKDIMMIEPIIGLGELAISDHRSSHPSLDELGRLCSEARVGGLLSGKAGIVNFHLGDAPAGLKPLEELVAAGDMPRTQFLPTHCNRNPDLFVESLRWAKEGGFADVTTSTVQRYLDEGEVAASEAIRRFYEAGSIDQLTCTSDGQGSLPIFDAAGVLVGLTMGSSSSLWKAAREAILKGGVPLAEAVKTVTSTPARALKLGRKGRLAVGADADILLVSREGLEIRGLAAMGRILMKEGKVLVRGTFEAD